MTDAPNNGENAMAKNNFERYDVALAEFGGALAEALRRGGATEEEIRAELMGVEVDAAMPDPGPTYKLTRQQQPHAN
ncbi:hypothetical protein [Sphaerisporangium fuscum]|uniref:hypothetical protein n=1 Tax=Sphaerisporangium fuscum TaxID=2835868 RepID=UPI001BDC370D|nr:hypothetical protein [Sphaerisporangium fuscum]